MILSFYQKYFWKLQGLTEGERGVEATWDCFEDWRLAGDWTDRGILSRRLSRVFIGLSAVCSDEYEWIKPFWAFCRSVRECAALKWIQTKCFCLIFHSCVGYLWECIICHFSSFLSYVFLRFLCGQQNLTETNIYRVVPVAYALCKQFTCIKLHNSHNETIWWVLLLFLDFVDEDCRLQRSQINIQGAWVISSSKIIQSHQEDSSLQFYNYFEAVFSCFNLTTAQKQWLLFWSQTEHVEWL